MGLVTKRAKDISKRNGLPLIGESVFSEYTNKTFFILGSGASVENLTDEDFKVISQGFSIGINTWPVHDFIPTAYAFESFRDVGRCDTISCALDRIDVHQKLPFIFLELNSFRVNDQNRIKIPEILFTKIFLYGKIPAITNDLDMLSKYLKRFLLDSRKGRIPNWISFSQNATIERLALLGIMLGFKDIVFVGVDLNNTRYFWEKNPKYLTRRGLNKLVSGQTGTVHKTADLNQRKIPTPEVIKLIAKHGYETHGAKCWAADKASALSEFLAVYDFQNFCASSEKKYEETTKK